MEKKKRHETRLWTKNFTLICIINFLIFMNHIMLLSTFPLYIGSIGGSDAVAGAATALFCVIAVICRPFVGWMVDTKGRRIVLIAGTIGMALTSLGYVFLSMLSVILLFRMIQGGYLSCSNTSCSTIASDTIPRSRFAEGMGMFGLSNAAATAAAPALGLLLMDRFGFDLLFYTAAAAMMAAFLLGLILKVPKNVTKSKKISMRDLLEKNALPASSVLLAFLLAFGAIEAFIAKYAMVSGLPGGGIFFAVMAAATISTRLGAGKLADKRGEAIFVYTCNLSMFAAMLLLGCFSGTVYYLAAAVLTGYGFGGISPALQAMAVHAAEPASRGAANSTFLCAYDIGIGFGAGIAGMLITAFGFAVMFAILSMACVVSVIIYLIFGRNHASSFTCAIKLKKSKRNEITLEE